MTIYSQNFLRTLDARTCSGPWLQEDGAGDREALLLPARHLLWSMLGMDWHFRNLLSLTQKHISSHLATPIADVRVVTTRKTHDEVLDRHRLKREGTWGFLEPSYWVLLLGSTARHDWLEATTKPPKSMPLASRRIGREDFHHQLSVRHSVLLALSLLRGG